MATEYTVRSKYLKFDTTEVVIHRESPYTIFSRELQGDQTGKSDEELIEAVKSIIRAELDQEQQSSKHRHSLNKLSSRLLKTRANRIDLLKLSSRLKRMRRLTRRSSMFLS